MDNKLSLCKCKYDTKANRALAKCLSIALLDVMEKFTIKHKKYQDMSSAELFHIVDNAVKLFFIDCYTYAIEFLTNGTIVKKMEYMDKMLKQLENVLADNYHKSIN